MFPTPLLHSARRIGYRIGCCAIFVGATALVTPQARAEPDSADPPADSGPSEAPASSDAPTSSDAPDDSAEEPTTPQPDSRGRARERLDDLARAGRGLATEEQEYRRHRRHMITSWLGPVGGLRVVDAGSGSPQSVRVVLGGTGAATGGWLVPGERNTELGMAMGVNWSPFPWLEVYGMARAWQNSAYRIRSPFVTNTSRTWVGAKAFASPVPWLHAGGDFRLQAPLNSTRGVGAVYGATSVELRANASVDLRDHARVRKPVVLRLNAGYLFENFGRAVRPIEAERYEALADDLDPPARPMLSEDRHLLTRPERFALQLDRVDIATLGFGAEFPLEVKALRTTVSPIVEWVLDAPVARQSPPCVSNPSPGVDPCRSISDGAAFRQAAVFGARVHPPTGGLSAYVAGEVGLFGVREPVQELAPQIPYRIYFGLNYITDFYTPGR